MATATVRTVAAVLLVLALALAAGCTGGSEAPPFDPLAAALATAPGNLEASVPAPCYARTDGQRNPCYACHTRAHGLNARADFDLQSAYDFSDRALENHWLNLFVDYAELARPGAALDEARIRDDNYTPLRHALQAQADYPGFVPDLDLTAGFDPIGFARDGSGWRAVRYQPFPGFWPSRGNAGDLFIRLPDPFRRDAAGAPSLAVYRLNLALLEAAIAGDPERPAAAIGRDVESVDERLIDFDLDGDGAIGRATHIDRLPPHYAGGAARHALRRGVYPGGVEFLHSVRYLDPDRPGMAAPRMKELRYSRKVEELDNWAILHAYEAEQEERDEGKVPVYAGSAMVGLKNAFGWQLQGFIEDGDGRLRLQSDEEHRFCMGCHTAIGVTVNQTFAFPRKVPGAEGWRVQDLRGLRDRPQIGQAVPEAQTYFARAGGGDDFGTLPAPASPPCAGGCELLDVAAPTRDQAVLLNSAYHLLMRTQRFDRGRDVFLHRPAAHLHINSDERDTKLTAAERIYLDARLHLNW